MIHLILAFLLFSNSSSFSANTTTNHSVSNLTAQPTVVGAFKGEFVGNFSVVPLGPRVSAAEQIGALPRILDAILGAQDVAFDALVKYGYFSLFTLMLLDSSALPPPSEFVMPPAGYLARVGFINFGFAFLVLLSASLIGITIDYLIGYHLGRSFIYKHAKGLNIKEKDLRAFEKFFSKKESIIVFVCRLIPGFRIIISFVSGFTKMPLDEYYLFSIMGIAVYNYVLMVLGYFLVSESSSVSLISLTVVVPVLIFLIYRYAMKRIRE